MSSDLQRIQTALAPVEYAARSLPWSRERPWAAASHLRQGGDIPSVDLHDLNVKLGRQAVRRVADMAHELDAGAVHFITGRGRHAISGRSVLRQVVGEELVRICQDNHWDFSPTGAGRFTLVVDPARAPREAGRLGWGCWLGIAAFSAALIYAIPPTAVLIPAVALGFWYMERRAHDGEDAPRGE